MRERQGRPLLLIDIAVPRDIEAACAELDGVSLYDIDDLQAVVARNISTREGELPARRGDRRGGDPPLRPLARPARHAADDERPARARQRARRAGARRERRPLGVSLAADLARIEAVARAVTSRLLHEPTIRLRSLSEQRGHASLELVRELFGLREDESSPQQAPNELAEVHDLPARAQEGMPSGHAAAARADAPRHPWQRAGAGAGGARRAAAGGARAPTAERHRRARPDRDARRPRVRRIDDAAGALAGDGGRRAAARRGQVALGQRVGASAAERRDRPRPCTRPRTFRASCPTASSWWPHRPGGAEDVLCGAAWLDALAPGARVGTSSVRRMAQLRAAREDLTGRAARQRRHAPRKLADPASVSTRSCSPVPGCSGSDARDASARCSTPSASCRRPARARWRSRPAPGTRRARGRWRRSATRGALDCLWPSASSPTRSARAAPRRSAPTP